uniref:sulfotransferase 1 family member D1-like isoform X2 n=1 Tax=Pristiophorus japonicus TaxID=55135 RepID=UPI00398E4B3F
MSLEDPLSGIPANVWKRFPLKLVEGVPLMEPIADNWAQVASFEALPDDLLIATYPKAGTTWMQEIVDLIATDGDLLKSRRAPTHLRCPFLEICSPARVLSGVEQLSKATSPRMIKTHLPIQLIPKSFWEQGCKLIYVARNAKDNAVSYYHFHRMNKTQPDPGLWEEFIVSFMEGKVAWGSWYDHVKGFWEQRKKHRILYVFFEDMKEDPKREILKVMQFMGKDLSDEKIKIITQNTSFQVMKDNPMANYSSFPPAILDHSISPFMRKGVVGDWKTHFTVAESEAFEADYRRKMGQCSLRFRLHI